MFRKANINSGANTFSAQCIVLVIIALWSLISYRFAIALIIPKADKIEYKPNRASYYTRGLSQESFQYSPLINVSDSFSRKERTSDMNQLDMAAGAEMLHQLIYELAVGYKHIPRVSLLTCHHGSPARRLERQTWTSINIDTLTILRTLFTSKDSRWYRGYKSDGGSITNSFSSSDRRRLEQQSPPKGVLIKVLRIDLLINSKAGKESANKKPTDIPGLATMETFLQSEVLRQVVVLDLSCGLASRKVIEMASNKGLFNSSYHWLLIEDYTFNRQRDDNNDDADDDDDDVDPDGGVQNDFQLPFNATIASISGATSSSVAKDKKINNDGGYGDDNIDNGRSVANDSNDNVGENNLLIEKFLEKINININTELILAKRINGDQDSKEDYYMLYDVWSPGIQYSSSLNVTKIGKFSKGSGLQLQKWYRQTSTVIRRMDMKSSRIRCMIVVTNKNHTDSLEDYLTQQYDTHLDSMNRFNFALLSHVRDLFNFSLVMSRTSSWGYLKNGKFDGMIGALVRRQADIGGSPIFFRIERAKVIDYTTRTWIARPCFMFRHPRTLRTDQIVFLQPFTNDVWVLVAICGGLTILLLSALAVVERNFSNDSNNSSDRQVIVQARRIKSAESATIKENRKNNQQQQRNIYSTKDTRKREKERQIGTEVSSFTQKDALPLAQSGILGDVAPCWWGFDSTRCSGGGDATTLSNERLNTRVAVYKREQFPSDYGGDVGGSATILNRNAIDCIDYGVGVSVPGNEVLPHNNDSSARDFLIKNTFKKSSTLWKSYFNVKIDGILCRDGVDRVLESLLFYIGSICQQGLSFSTNLLSGRCIVITSLLFSFYIYQFYSASIVGSLLMEKPKTIRSLRDLVQSSLEIGIEDIIYNREYFLRTRDPVAIELYAKKVTTVPPSADEGFAQVLPPDKPPANMTKEQAKKNYKAVIHSHETGAHAKTTEASNWYDPEYGVAKIKQGGFAFHIDVATAYKIISDTFTEKEICDLSEIQLFPPQKMVSIVQKGSPLRKVITYGLRRTMEAGLMDYQRKVWHSPKPRCVKQIHTDDLRVDMQTFTSAVFVLIFGFAASIAVLALEMVHNNLWQYFAT